MDELLISIPCLILAIILIELMRVSIKCARCGHGTPTPRYRHLQGKQDYPILPYCLKCYFYINLSGWECDNCKSKGTTRIHKLNFLSRFLVIRRKKNVYKKCPNCKNKVELVQK